MCVTDVDLNSEAGFLEWYAGTWITEDSEDINKL